MLIAFIICDICIAPAWAKVWESGESRGNPGNWGIGESGNPGSPRNCHSLPVFIAPTKSQSAAVKICANLCANELCI